MARDLSFIGRPHEYDARRVPAGRITALAKRAGRLAEKQRKTGYH
jgi:hypothetical protein